MSLTTNPSLLGQANLSGSDTALFLKKFSGEVLATYDQVNVVGPMVRTATIDSGKTYQFPVLGEAEAVYHQRAESLYDITKNYLNNIEHGERTINVDRPLISSVFVDNWDDLINHYDTRSAYAKELGKALAVKDDKTVIRLLILAARSLATLTTTQNSTKAGLELADAAMASTTSVLIEHMREAMQSLVEKDVPMDELVCLVRPAQYFALVNDGTFINADYNTANGSKAAGLIDKAWGFKVIHSNHIPSTVISAEPGELNTYSGDFTKTVAVCFHKSAVGAVSRQGVTMETEYSVERQGTLMAAKMIKGYGILRPECAVELKTT